MPNPVLFWTRIFGPPDPTRRPRRPLPEVGPELATAGIIVVMRRMRAPLITLVAIFAVSVLGLSLVEGVDPEGRPVHLSLFESFYFMSFTATTIGFGEIPHAFTPEQRMWVTFSIFLSVVGWAYAVGSMFALMQDRAFRRALARRRFAREVRRIADPFLLIVGYDQAAKMLARSLDGMGRRFVVIDAEEERVSMVDLDEYRAEVPVLHGDARHTGEMVLAGLGHPHCEGVVALTGADETNLDVTMTTALIRPDLLVIARATSREIGSRMRAFHPQVINPLDRFGDHLRILIRSPAAYQLMLWLTSAPGTPLPARRPPVPQGRWVLCGYSSFGRELTEDLRAERIDVSVVEDPAADPSCIEPDGKAVAAIVAATGSDTTNLWLIERAHRLHPAAYVVAMQNHDSNSSLYAAIGVDFGMVPAEVIGHEVMARIANPALMRFLPHVPHQGEEWAARTVDRLVEQCGSDTPHLWSVELTAEAAPAMVEWLEHGAVTVGDLLRDPRDRDRPLPAVALARLRDGEDTMAPDEDEALRPGDQILLAGRTVARDLLDGTLLDLASATYVLDGRTVPSGWVWRKITGRYAGRRN